MAMNNIQRIIATALADLVVVELQMKARREIIIALWNAEGMASLLDTDYQEIPEFAHITSAEAIAAKAAELAMSTTMGDFTAGTNAQKMARFVNRVP